ncbi:MAG: hypothetical protein DMG40_01845 [Acidobacteria bacterium]|nr:MAG: hypothetical protein DMG40_01845 [Acidobacteriota bacterium]
MHLHLAKAFSTGSLGEQKANFKRKIRLSCSGYSPLRFSVKSLSPNSVLHLPRNAAPTSF